MTRLCSWVLAWVVVLLAGGVAAQERGRPTIVSDLGYRVIRTDEGTLLRGVSLSWDGGDPFGSAPKVIPSDAQLRSLREDYGLNAIHLYLEGNSSTNTDPIGVNLADADDLVARTADAGLYLIITIGCNGENGSIFSLQRAVDFWSLYAPRYADRTHVIYEAHNEPALFTPNQWTLADWDRQVVLYDTIRASAPETLVLLGSFMGFAGDPRFGAGYLADAGVDWSNAAFAHHGYESKAGIENAIGLLQADATWPAQLSTEFFPGDTEGQAYNAMYESHLNGWMQFQWLVADDNDLHDFRSKINAAGTVWTPDDAVATWPARGEAAAPADGTTGGLFHRGSSRFVRADAGLGGVLRADGVSYTAGASDSFTFEAAFERVFRLRAGNGRYVRTAGQSGALIADGTGTGGATLFEWIRVPSGDVALRAISAEGHLVRRSDSLARLVPDADDGRDRGAHFVLVTAPGVTPAPLVGDPFFGRPAVVPARVEAEDFDFQNAGAGFADADAGNNGGAYRTLEDVDIEPTQDAGGGFNVGWFGSGEFMDYTLRVPGTRPALYRVSVRAAAAGAGGAFSLSFGGVDATGPVAVPSTGGFQSWATVGGTLELAPGDQIMRVASLGSAFNLNFIEIECARSGCDADLDGDGLTDAGDLREHLALVSTGAAGGEFDGVGGVDFFDTLAFIECWTRRLESPCD